METKLNSFQKTNDDKIDKKLEAFKKSAEVSNKAINSLLKNFCTNFCYALIDIVSTMNPGQKPNNEQINFMSESFKRHQIAAIKNCDLKNYIDKLYKH